MFTGRLRDVALILCAINFARVQADAACSESSPGNLVKTTCNDFLQAVDPSGSGTAADVVSATWTPKPFVAAAPVDRWSGITQPAHTANPLTVSAVVRPAPTSVSVQPISIQTHSLNDLGIYSYHLTGVAGQVFVASVDEDGNPTSFGYSQTPMIPRDIQFPIFNSPPTSTSMQAVPQPLHVGHQLSLVPSPKDPDGGNIAFLQWSILSKPTGATAGLSNPAALTPQVNMTDATDIGNWSFKLTMSDDEGQLGTASVNATVANQPPILVVDGNYDIHPPAHIHLTAKPATDADGETLTFVWDIIDTPTTSTHHAQMHYLTTSVIDFPLTGKDVGPWHLRCTATDPHGATDVRDAMVTVEPNPPSVAVADPDRVIRFGQPIHLETIATTDGYGDPLKSFSWDIEQVPVSAGIGLVSGYSTSNVLDIPATSAQPGTWLFRIRVTDQNNAKADYGVRVLVDADPVAHIVGPDESGNLSLPLDLDGSTSVDPDSPQNPPDFDHLHSGPMIDISPGITQYQWRIEEVPDGLTPGRYRAGNVSDVLHIPDTDAQLHIPKATLPDGDWEFALDVTDHEGNTATDEHWVKILDEGMPPQAIVTPVTTYTTDAAGNLASPVIIDGSASFDPDNLLSDPYTPGLGITDYTWNLYQSPCPQSQPASGTNATSTTLYPPLSVIPAPCQGVYSLELQVTDDDSPLAKKGFAYTQAVIVNCADWICLDYPTTLSPQLITFSDQTDVMIYYHLNSLLYNSSLLADGMRVRLDVYKDDIPTVPVYSNSWDMDLLPTDQGGSLTIHWSGYDNLGRRPQPGKYNTVLHIVDNAGNDIPNFAQQIDNIWIQTLDVFVNATTSDTIVRPSLQAGTAWAVHYTVGGQLPNQPGFDQLRFRIVDDAGTLITQRDVGGPYTSTFLWDGKLADGTVIARGSYKLEIELLNSGASVATSARFSFKVVESKLHAAGSVATVETSTGAFVAASTDTVDATSFGYLKYRMRPLVISAGPTFSNPSAELGLVSGPATAVEFYKTDGTPVTLPVTWSAADFPTDGLSKTLLAYGKDSGQTVTLRLRTLQNGTVIDERLLKLRVGIFPGTTGISTGGEYPFFHVRHTFNRMDPLSTALDPARHIERVGRTAAVYVVAHKDPSTWATNPTLIDVMNGPLIVTLAPGSIAANILNLGTPSTTGQYDLVYDFGAQDSTMPFATDGKLDPGDILDSTARPSLTIEDSAVKLGPLPTLTLEYGLTSPTTVFLSAGFDGLNADFFFRLRGRLVFPAAPTANSPLVVFMPGNHIPLFVMDMGALRKVDSAWVTDENFRGYDYLQQQLASHGYVTLCIDQDEINGNPALGFADIDGSGIQLRAWIALKNIEKVLTDPSVTGPALTGKIDPSRLYLVGHSRGGEAVIAMLDQLKGNNRPPLLPDLNPSLTAAGVRGIVSLSPTSAEVLVEAPVDVPYLLLYGSADGDVDGAEPWVAPFRHYDRATKDKYAVRIIGANHDFFNDSWPASDANQRVAGSTFTAIIVPSVDIGAGLITRPVQKDLAKGYLTQFLKMVDGHDTSMAEYFTEPPSQLRPLGTDPTVPLVSQSHHQANVTVIDDYETQPTNPVSSSTQSVTGTVNHWSEEVLKDTDVVKETELWNRFFQDTRGVLFDWMTPENYVESIDPTMQDFRSAKVLSFRIAQQPKPPTVIGPMSIGVALQDLAGNLSTINTIALDPIPGIYPVKLRSGMNTTSAAFETFRLPISSFIADGRSLDLSHIVKIRFLLGGGANTSHGRVAIDDIEIER